MFIREVKNRSGSVSVQLISKAKGKYKVVKSFGSATTRQEIENLKSHAREEKYKLESQSQLFSSEKDQAIEKAFSQLHNSSIRTVGPELVFGKIYDYIGFSQINEDLFRHLVISRLAFPLSKLKTSEYLYRYQRVKIKTDAIYRFLDKLNNSLNTQVEQIAFSHTMKVLNNNISVVFYDMTTLYFEASDEDDLRKTGFSKDGKHHKPQIFIGLLVGLGGYAIGYDIFEGNIYEGHTLIPFIEQISKKFDISMPIIVADAGLLSNSNIKALQASGYEYILGGRPKNETKIIKDQILADKYTEGTIRSYPKDKHTRLIVHYSNSRASKDSYNRKRGLKRLEKRIKSGKLNKSSINNRGYNKYLKLTGDVTIEIDYNKFNNDDSWDGLKAYVTNTKLNDKQVLENYKNLWHIERAFRMSKTDLRIRPVYHRLQDRIEAHICISFTAYCIYKELERALNKEDSELSLKKATEITKNIYQISYTLPESKQAKSLVLQMDKEQKELMGIINKNF